MSPGLIGLSPHAPGFEVLLEKAVELLGGPALLEEEHHWR